MSLLSTRLREERRWATPRRRRPGDLTITITVDNTQALRQLTDTRAIIRTGRGA